MAMNSMNMNAIELSKRSIYEINDETTEETSAKRARHEASQTAQQLIQSSPRHLDFGRTGQHLPVQSQQQSIATFVQTLIDPNSQQQMFQLEEYHLPEFQFQQMIKQKQQQLNRSQSVELMNVENPVGTSQQIESEQQAYRHARYVNTKKILKIDCIFHEFLLIYEIFSLFI